MTKSVEDTLKEECERLKSELITQTNNFCGATTEELLNRLKKHRISYIIVRKFKKYHQKAKKLCEPVPLDISVAWDHFRTTNKQISNINLSWKTVSHNCNKYVNPHIYFSRCSDSYTHFKYLRVHKKDCGLKQWISKWLKDKKKGHKKKGETVWKRSKKDGIKTVDDIDIYVRNKNLEKEKKKEKPLKKDFKKMEEKKES